MHISYYIAHALVTAETDALNEWGIPNIIHLLHSTHCLEILRMKQKCNEKFPILYLFKSQSIWYSQVRRYFILGNRVTRLKFKRIYTHIILT